MGSDCYLGHCFQFFLAYSPDGTSAFAKDSQPASGFGLCLGKVWFPGLPLAKFDSKICCFFTLLQRGSTKSDDAGFLFWGQGEQGCERLVLVDLLTYAHRSQWSIGHQRPPAIALCSGLLLSVRTNWSPAVSALLQCLASNCCEAGLSSSSPVGSRSGLGVW